MSYEPNNNKRYVKISKWEQDRKYWVKEMLQVELCSPERYVEVLTWSLWMWSISAFPSILLLLLFSFDLIQLNEFLVLKIAKAYNMALNINTLVNRYTLKFVFYTLYPYAYIFI